MGVLERKNARVPTGMAPTHACALADSVPGVGLPSCSPRPFSWRAIAVMPVEPGFEGPAGSAATYSAQMEAVTSGSPINGPIMRVGTNNKILVSLLLNEFSDKVNGAIDAGVQVSNDAQNWTQIGSVSALFDKAGTLQTGTFPVSARFCRIVMQASPTGNTVSYAQDAVFSNQ